MTTASVGAAAPIIGAASSFSNFARSVTTRRLKEPSASLGVPRKSAASKAAACQFAFWRRSVRHTSEVSDPMRELLKLLPGPLERSAATAESFAITLSARVGRFTARFRRTTVMSAAVSADAASQEDPMFCDRDRTSAKAAAARRMLLKGLITATPP